MEYAEILKQADSAVFSQKLVGKGTMTMSGIAGIYGGAGSLSLADLLAEAREENSILDTSATAASAERLLAEKASSRKRAKGAYESISPVSGIGQAALSRALSEMGALGGKVTFSDIAVYGKKLEESFSAQVRLDLAKLDVPPDKEFTLTMTSEGRIQVDCDSQADKEKIQRYLESNPKICEQFGYIQALANLDRARQSPAAHSLAWRQMKNAGAELQTQAVEAFFSASLSSGMNYGSLLASFGSLSGEGETGAALISGASPSASFYAGVDYTV